MTEGIRVRGGATREEIAVVLAVIGPRAADTDVTADGDAYRRWRRIRRDAMRRTDPGR